MRFHGLFFLLAALVFPTGSLLAHPNDSIGRERVAPTPYGQRLSRAGEADFPLPGFVDEYFQYDTEIDEASRAQFVAAIKSAEKSSGAYASELIEPLALAGRAYQSVQDYGEAMDYFVRALHLSRVNQGLYSPTQLPILDGMFNTQLAAGNLVKADEIQNYRFRVQQHAFADDPPALMAATDGYLEWQQQMYLSEYGDETYLRLLRMHKLQSDMIEQLDVRDDSKAALIAYLYKRLDSEYLLADYKGEKQPAVQISISSPVQGGAALSTNLEEQEFRMIRNNCFRSGVKTLERIVELTQSQRPTQIEEIARAKIALGDWYLWWDHKARAMQNYRAAYAVYTDDDDPATDPGRLFAEPVELPQESVFRPVLNTPTQRTMVRARVSLSVSSQGKARDIEILELDAEDDMGARVTLYNMLKQVRFRPLVVDGRVVAASSVVREYRFDH